MQMNTQLRIVLFSLGCLCAGNLSHVLAEETTGNDLDKAAVAYNQKQKNKTKVVCKREAPIGSRIKKRVCRSVFTIENQHEEGKRFMKKNRIGLGEQR